jgi:hypothetical protein
MAIRIKHIKWRAEAKETLKETNCIEILLLNKNDLKYMNQIFNPAS